MNKKQLSKLGNKNPNWVGDKIKYTPLHIWINRHKPKSEICENCNEKKPLELANISGLYKRDINDFKWLCRKCHMIEDGRLNNLMILNKDPEFQRKNIERLRILNKDPEFQKKRLKKFYEYHKNRKSEEILIEEYT